MEIDKLYKSLFSLILLVLFLSPAINAAGPSAVNLGTSGSFAILAKSGISATGTTSVTGDIGVSPIDQTALTGFSQTMDSSNQFSTSVYVVGKLYAADYAPPAPAKMTTAVSDMETAYTDAAGRTNPTATELGAGNIGGMTLAPGLYKWGTGVTIPTDVTLSGGSNDVWIFQIAQNLDISSATQVILSGGAQSQNIFWQVAGQATLGTTSDFKGIILTQTAVVMNTGAKLNGRALAQTAVTLDADAVTAPTGSAPPAPTPTPTPAPSPSPQPNATSNGSVSPAPTGSTTPTTTSNDNPIIVPSPSSQQSGSLTQAQIAQNLALGLPVGTSSSTTSVPVSTPTAQPTSTPTPQPTTDTTTPTTEAPSVWIPRKLPTLPSTAPAATAAPTTSTGESTIPGANLQTLVVAAIVVILASGLYYYLKVMKK